jgi:hypothetical protein
MKLESLKPPFQHVARCVAYLAFLVGMVMTLILAAMHFPPMSDVFNPHSTFGALMLLGLFGLALVDFIALMYFVPLAVVELYRQPTTRTAFHWAAMVLGVIAIALLGTWLDWFYQR